jgi:oligopeptide transport system permease protein
MPIVLLLLITLSFFLMRFAPGGPFDGERDVDPAIEAALGEKYNLNEPLHMQYFLYVKDLCKGDLGPSFKHRARSVNEIIANTLPHSLFVGFLAMGLAIASGIGAGIVAALRHNSVFDYGSMTLAVLGISLPTFVIGPLLQLACAIYNKWLPVAGYDSYHSPSYLVLPAITLALPFTARIARLMRAGMLDVLNQDFVRTARAKGLRERVVIMRHTLRGGVLPVLSYLGPAIAAAMTGSLVIEKIFQIPGLGREFVEAALNRDYTLVMGTVIVFGVLLIIMNLLVDIAYAMLDPRVEYD